MIGVGRFIGIGVNRFRAGGGAVVQSGSKTFNGTSDLVAYEDDAKFDFTDDFWIYAKVNVTSMANYRAIISKEDGTNYEIRMAFNSTGRLYVWVYYGGVSANNKYFRTGSAAFSSGVEYEIFVSYDASTHSLIILRNGSDIGTETVETGSITTVSNTDADLNIGAVKTGASTYVYYFPGEIITIEAGVGYFTTYAAADGVFMKYNGT